MKKYQTAKELLATKAENKEKKPIYATRKLSIGLVSCMLGLLMAAPIARAEELPPAPGVEAAGQKETPAKVEEAPAKVEEDLLTEAEIKEIKDRALNLGDNKYVFTTSRVDQLKERLRKIKAENPDNFAKLKKDAIDNAIIEFIPANRGEERAIQNFRIAGGANITTETTKVSVSAYGFEVGQKIDLLVNNQVKDTFTQTGKRAKSTIVMNVGELKEGDTIKAVVYDSSGNQIAHTSEYTVKKAVEKKNKTLANQLKMPEGEIFIEDTAASLPDFIEKNKALEMFWAKNADLKGDIKSVDFSINGDTNAYYKVTFDDKSTLKVEATKLKIKKPTETTPKPEIQQTFVADGVITIKLKSTVAKGTAYGIVKSFSDGEEKKYCDGICKLDKNSPTWYTLDKDTKTITYTVDKDFLQYGQIFGVVVKEYGKLSSCQSQSPKIKIPELIGVRDPKKLTETEKDKIREEIRKANTTAGGVSKLPDWTAQNVPAIIDISDDGNVKIINPSDIEEHWENNTKLVPKRNPDGSIIMKPGKENSGIPIENTKIIENKAPEIPKIELSDDKKTITVTPDSADTDATEVSVTYTPEGETNTKTITAKKDPTDKKWKLDPAVDGIKVDKDTGKITINTSLVAGGTNVNGSVKDAGFPEKSKDKDKEQKVSEKGATLFKKADKLLSIGDLDPVVMKKWVGDTPNWKDGVKVKDGGTEADKAKIKALLDEATTEFVGEGRNTEKAGTFKGTIKVKFSDGSSIDVAGQTLMVCDHVTSTTDPKLPTGAIDVQIKLGEGVKVEDKDQTSGHVTKTTKGDKNNPVVYKEYKVKPGTNLKTYKHPTLQKTIFELIDEKADEGYQNPVWKGEDTNDAQNFVVAANNKVFIATATSTTEKFTVTVKPNGGNGKETVVTKNKGDKFKLPPANTFTPANENQEFDKWDVDGTKYEPNKEITINKNTVVKATWKAKGTNPNPSQPGGSGTGGSTQDPSQPGTGTNPEPTPSNPEPGTTPGSENPKDKPTDPDKNNPDQKDKPEDKKSGEDNKDKPKTPNVEKGDKVINVGDKEVVVPKVVVDKKKGKLDKEERTKIAEKIKQKNPDVVDVKIDEKANAFVTFNDGRRERILAKDLVSKEGFVIPRRDRHSQDESPNRRRAGKNVKTGVESIAGIACTLVASTGALYIGRKKED